MHWPDSFQANRWIRTLNLLFQAVLFLTLFGGVNYLALHHTWRFDLTRNRFFSLSAETRSYLDQLTKPVHVVVAFERTGDDEVVAQARRDVLSLLREYTYATRRDNEPLLTTEELDVYQQRRRAENLGLTDKNVVVFLCGDRKRIVSGNELYDVKGLVKRAFTGERAFTAAILDVTNATRQTLYFLVGHGEMDPTSIEPNRGLSQYRDELRARNFDVATLDLSSVRHIPDDAAMVLSIAPLTSFLAQEQEILRQYLATRAGRLLLALVPRTNPALDQLLADWGVRAEDVLVVDPNPQEFEEGNDLILQRFVAHPITQVLLDYKVKVVTGETRVVHPDSSHPTEATLNVTPLIGTSPTAWGEKSYRLGGFYKFDAGDLKGAPPDYWLPVAVVSERVTAANLPFSVRGGRLIVFGTADFLSNNRIKIFGNMALARNAVSWATERDTQLNIPPRPVDQFQLALSQTELGHLRVSLLLIVPGAIALLGLMVYWIRRS